MTANKQNYEYQIKDRALNLLLDTKLHPKTKLMARTWLYNALIYAGKNSQIELGAYLLGALGKISHLPLAKIAQVTPNGNLILNYHINNPAKYYQERPRKRLHAA